MCNIGYLGFWELLNYPDFKTPEFGEIRMEAGTNRFYISVNKFVDQTMAYRDIATLQKKGLQIRLCVRKDSLPDWQYRQILPKLNYKSLIECNLK